MMPVLTTTKRKGRPCLVEMAVHSSSVADRPNLVRRCAVLMVRRIRSAGPDGFRTLVLPEPIRLCHTAVTSRPDDVPVIERTAGLLDTERLFT